MKNENVKITISLDEYLKLRHALNMAELALTNTAREMNEFKREITAKYRLEQAQEIALIRDEVDAKKNYNW